MTPRFDAASVSADLSAKNRGVVRFAILLLAVWMGVAAPQVARGWPGDDESEEEESGKDQGKKTTGPQPASGFPTNNPPGMSGSAVNSSSSPSSSVSLVTRYGLGNEDELSQLQLRLMDDGAGVSRFAREHLMSNQDAEQLLRLTIKRSRDLYLKSTRGLQLQKDPHFRGVTNALLARRDAANREITPEDENRLESLLSDGLMFHTRSQALLTSSQHARNARSLEASNSSSLGSQVQVSTTISSSALSPPGSPPESRSNRELLEGAGFETATAVENLKTLLSRRDAAALFTDAEHAYLSEGVRIRGRIVRNIQLLTEFGQQLGADAPTDTIRADTEMLRRAQRILEFARGRPSVADSANPGDSESTDVDRRKQDPK